MKKLLFTLALGTFLMAGCSQGDAEKAKEEAIKKEIMVTDSTTKVLEKTKEEIKKTADQLENALDAL